jgi:hypothetical protein
MKRIVLIAMALVLTACAHMNQAGADSEFEAFRADLRGQREAGTITAVQEQEMLRDKFHGLFGRDPDSVGHFAFATELARSVEAGDFPAGEADALIGARQQAMLATTLTRAAESKYEYPDN